MRKHIIRKSFNPVKFFRGIGLVIILALIITFFIKDSATGTMQTDYKQIIVKKGDTIWGIARDNKNGGTNIEEVIYAIKMTNKIYPIFLKRGGGTIININSLAGLESQPLRSTYCASKWGLRGFTETLRIEAAPDNIKVMAIYPSRIKTRPEFASYGWEPREVAHKIYIAYKDGVLDLDLDARPEEFKKKR